MAVYHLLATSLHVVAACLLGCKLAELHFGDARFGRLAKEHLIFHDLTDISRVRGRVLRGRSGRGLLGRPDRLSLGHQDRGWVELSEEQTGEEDHWGEKNGIHATEFH